MNTTITLTQFGLGLSVLLNVWLMVSIALLHRRNEDNANRLMKLMELTPEEQGFMRRHEFLHATFQAINSDPEPTDEQLYDRLVEVGAPVGPRDEWLASRRGEVTYPRCPQCACHDTHPTDLDECTCPDCGCVFEVDPETNECTVLTPREWEQSRRHDDKTGPTPWQMWLGIIACGMLLLAIYLTYA